MTTTTMPDHTPRPSRNQCNDADCERQRIDAIFADFLGKYRASQGTAVLPPPPAPTRQPCPQPMRGPGWRYIRVIDPPQITTERWEALSRSQIRAARLLRAGSIGHALQALREGMWRNPEEELRKLVIHFPRKRRPSLLTNHVDQRAATPTLN